MKKAKLALATVTTVGILSVPLVLSRPDIESFPKAFTAHLKAEEAKAVSLGRPSTGFHGGWKDLFLFPTVQNYYVLAKATVPLRCGACLYCRVLFCVCFYVSVLMARFLQSRSTF